MLFILFHLIINHQILARCDHDDIQKQIPDPFNETFPNTPIILDDEEAKPIRIYFDLKNVKLTILGEDSAVNKSSSAYIKAADIYQSLEISLNNLADYCSRLLKVKPLKKPITPPNYVHDIACSSKPVEADLFIAVKVRSYTVGSKILGQAFYSQTNPTDGRPIIGGMYLNKYYFPETPQNENSLERLFFTTIFHEMCHVFGISGSATRGWINKSSGTRYQPFPSYKYFNSTYQKTFTVIHTPAAHRYIEQRFGITEFAPGYPAGIEIEDGGGSGTAGSHPESRVYLSETMCGIFVGYTFISNLTLSLLDDTGWYYVDYSMGELYPWGDGRSLGYRNITKYENNTLNTYLAIEPIKNFINTAPQLAYPKHYMCWPGSEKKQSCHYDFRAKAFCSPLTTFSCDNQKNSDDRQCCKMKQFTNPLNWPIRGDREEFDYLIFKVPNTTLRCQDKTLNQNKEFQNAGELYSDDSMCAMSTLRRKDKQNAYIIDDIYVDESPGCYKMMCDSNDTLYVTVNSDTQICEYENQKIVFNGMDGYLSCPSPSLLCGMKSFIRRPLLGEQVETDFPNTEFISENNTDDADNQNKDGKSNKYSKKIVIIAAALGVAFGIIASAIAIYFIRKYSSRNYGKFNSKKQRIMTSSDNINVQINDSSSEETEAEKL